MPLTSAVAPSSIASVETRLVPTVAMDEGVSADVCGTAATAAVELLDRTVHKTKEERPDELLGCTTIAEALEWLELSEETSIVEILQLL